MDMHLPHGLGARLDVSLSCNLEDMARAGLIIETDGRTRLGDEFRIAASRLQSVIRTSIAADERCGNLVLVTSTRPAEGKSFAALNIAASLARTGSRSVLLIDADAKLRCLSELLGLSEAPGLLNLAANDSLQPDQMVISTAVQGLFVLPLGVVVADIRTANSQSLPAAAEQLSRRFPESTLIIDTGPLLATSDPSVLAPVASQILMVVEASRTQRSELEAALEMIKASPKVVLLLNKQAGRSRSSFGAYSYTGEYYAKPNTLPPPRS